MWRGPLAYGQATRSEICGRRSCRTSLVSLPGQLLARWSPRAKQSCQKFVTWRATTDAYSSRRRTPASAATAAIASLLALPVAPWPARRPPRRHPRSPDLASRRRAGHDQRDLAAHARRWPTRPARPARRAGPAHRSWSARGRPRPAGQRRTRRPGRPASRPAGAATRRRPACAAHRPARPARGARSPALRGRKPSKQNRSTGSPDTASAAITADGPGSTVTRNPAADRGGDQPVAGIAHGRHSGVGDQQHVLPGRAARPAAPACGRPRWPRRTTPPGRSSCTPRSAHSRRSRRVSSAAMTGAASAGRAAPRRRPPGRSARPPRSACHRRAAENPPGFSRICRSFAVRLFHFPAQASLPAPYDGSR